MLKVLQIIWVILWKHMGFAQGSLHLYAYFFTFLFSINSDLGVHVDGFISNVAHSFVIGATKVRVHVYAFLLHRYYIS